MSDTGPEIYWSEEAEQNCLGLALLHADAAERLVAELQPTDFYTTTHARLFQEMRRLRAEGLEIDPLVLGKRLQGRQWFADMGGVQYLHALTDTRGLRTRLDSYVRIVRTDAKKRRAQRIGGDLLNGSLDALEASEALREIAEDAVTRAPFITALDLARQMPEKLEPVVEGYFYRGSTAELSGRIKNGKTTVALDLASAVITGEPFLGKATQQSPVLYLTEQNRPSFGVALERAHLLGCPDLHLLFRPEYRAEWPIAAAEARREALEREAGLVVIDTLHEWVGMGKDEENDAGAASAAMRPVHELAAAGPAVVVLRHERKGGGELGESARGSSAFGGAVDVLLSLRRMTSPGHENRRELVAVSRFDGAPPKLVIELEDGRYRLLGEGDELEREEAQRRVLDHLPERPEDAHTFDALLEACGEGTTRTTLHRALTELVGAGQVEREKGAGEAGPRGFGYWKAEKGL